MASLSQETMVRISSEAAQSFIDWYYKAMNEPSSSIAPFYVNNNRTYAAAGGTSAAADISVNGGVVGTPAEYEALLKKQGPKVHYEIDCWDAHVTNPDFNMAAPAHLVGKPDGSGAKSSIAVQVSGRISYGRDKDAQQRFFNEMFVLVPNWDAVGHMASRNIRRWLILSQNFRAL